MNAKRINILFFSLILFCLTLFACRQSGLVSAWRNRPIKIDGKYTDWNGIAAYYDENTKVVLNLVNDADYLYICLISRNRAIETKIMESGFIVWFDPDAGQKKIFGIRFPIGLKRMGISIDDEEKRDINRDWQNQEDKSGLIDRDKERLKDKNFNKRLEKLESLQYRLEIIKGNADLKGRNKHLKSLASGGKTKDIVKDKSPAPEDMEINKPVELFLEEAEGFGIEARVGRENGYFVYELKVPLKKSAGHIYAIEAKKGKPIGLGLEVESLGAHMLGDTMDDRMPPGEGRMSEDRETMFGNPNRLKLWFSVVLSSGA